MVTLARATYRPLQIPAGFGDPSERWERIPLADVVDVAVGADTIAAKTKVTKKPKAKIKTKKRSVKVKVAFKSEQGAKFECKLDKAAYKPCASPYKVKVKARPGKGKKHTISIKARDGAGNVGKAATVEFKVIRKG